MRSMVDIPQLLTMKDLEKVIRNSMSAVRYYFTRDLCRRVSELEMACRARRWRLVRGSLIELEARLAEYDDSANHSLARYE